MRRRLLVIFPRHERGGHTRRLYLLLDALKDDEVHYLALEPLRYPERETLIPHLYPVKKGSFRWLLFFMKVFLAVFRQLFTKRFDGIVVFDPTFSLAAAPAAFLNRVPVTVVTRAVPWRMNAPRSGKRLPHRFERFMDLLGLAAATRIIVPTPAIREELSASPLLRKGPIVVLPNSTIYPRSLELEDGKPSEQSFRDWMAQAPSRKRATAALFDFPEKGLLVATLAELTPRKNIECAVRAIAASDEPRLRLVICGDGPERKKIFSLVIGFGITDRIAFTGWVERPEEILAGCDLLLIPSRYEGMSNSLLEAIGHGVPFLAADTPEMRALVEYPELLFNPDDIGSLVERLEALVKNRTELDKMRSLALSIARKYAFDWGVRLNAELATR